MQQSVGGFIMMCIRYIEHLCLFHDYITYLTFYVLLLILYFTLVSSNSVV